MRRFILTVVLFIIVPSVFGQNIDRERESWRERRSYDARRNYFELTAFGGYRFGGTIFADRTDLFGVDLDVASAPNLGASLGIPLGDTPLKLELMVNRQNTHLTTGSGLFERDERVADFDVTYYHGGIQIPFGESDAARPFFLLSAGVANLDPHIIGVSADNRFSASAGLGVKVPLSRNIGLRVEARGYFTSLGLEEEDDGCFRCDENDRNLYQGETNVGLVISF